MAAPSLLGEVEAARSSGEDEFGNATFTRVWKVTADNTYGAIAVQNALPVARGDTYAIGVSSDAYFEENTNAYVRSINCVQQPPDGTIWLCTVEYGSVSPDNQGNPDPTLDDPIVTWSAEQREQIVDEDVDGNPIVNSAGDKFDPPVTRDDSRPILVVERNEYLFDDVFADLFRNTVNAGVFFGRDAGTVKCRAIEATQKWNTLIGVYYRVRYEFHINADGWTKRILNAGMRQLVGPPPLEIQPILNKGVPVGEPVPLATDGTALTANGTVTYLDFDVYPEQDFDIMGLEG